MQRLIFWLVGRLADSSTETPSNGITQPTPASISDEIQSNAATGGSPPRPQPPSPPGDLQSLPGGTQKVTADDVPGFNALAYYYPTLDRPHVGDQLPSATSDRKHKFRSKEITRLLNPGAKDEEMKVSPTAVPSPARATTRARRGASSCTECRRCAYLSHSHHKDSLSFEFPG